MGNYCCGRKAHYGFLATPLLDGNKNGTGTVERMASDLSLSQLAASTEASLDNSKVTLINFDDLHFGRRIAAGALAST